MQSMIPSIAILTLVALAALILARRRNASGESAIERTAASRALVLATAAQSVHFVEEWATGFHIQFPALFGQDPMPLAFFVAFNLAWIAIWVFSVPLIRSGVRPAVFAAWFLALAGMLNALAHPSLAALVGSYFPGLISSPLIGVARLYLWRRLHRAF
jgi:hypothetical protein